jgi:hypothetical protein
VEHNLVDEKVEKLVGMRKKLLTVNNSSNMHITKVNH